MDLIYPYYSKQKILDTIAISQPYIRVGPFDNQTVGLIFLTEYSRIAYYARQVENHVSVNGYLWGIIYL